VKQRIGKTLLRYEPDPLQHAEPLKQSELGLIDFVSATNVSYSISEGIRSSFCAWGNDEKFLDDKIECAATHPHRFPPYDGPRQE
jgi:hypothetical protein